MRKYIIGGIMGFLLAFSISAHAEVVNVIGKVVDGTLNVTVNGNKLDSQAITIEGTSYLPVRAIGDALGLKVGYDATTGVSLNSSPSTVMQDQIKALGDKARTIFEQRRNLYTASIVPYESDNGKTKDDAYYAAKKQYDDMSKQLNDINDQIQALTKQQ